MLLKVPCLTVLEVLLGEGVKDVDLGYTLPATVRTQWQIALYTLQMYLRELRAWTLPALPVSMGKDWLWLC